MRSANDIERVTIIMRKRLVCIHFTSPPKIGGLELASWELSAAASRAEGWSSVLVTGTAFSKKVADSSPFEVIHIPELSTSFALCREIFQNFKQGKIHPSLKILSEHLKAHLLKHISSRDVLVSFNCFSQPFNAALTSALRDVTLQLDDLVHITWTFDIAMQEDGYDWRRRNEWPWSLFWYRCPKLHYAASSIAVARNHAELLRLPHDQIQIIPAGTDPLRVLKATEKIAKVCNDRDLLSKYPLLFMPAKISVRKNIPRAIDVMINLLEDHPKAHLVIAGSLSPHDIEAKENLLKLLGNINLKKLSSAVTVIGSLDEFDGTVSFEDTMAMMSISDGLLFTSRREGFLIPILEGVLFNLPIFTPKHDAVTCWAEDYIIAYNENASPHQISKTIALQYNNPKMKSKFEVRTQYSWDNIFEKHFLKYSNKGTFQ